MPQSNVCVCVHARNIYIRKFYSRKLYFEDTLKKKNKTQLNQFLIINNVSKGYGIKNVYITNSRLRCYNLSKASCSLMSKFSDESILIFEV